MAAVQKTLALLVFCVILVQVQQQVFASGTMQRQLLQTGAAGNTTDCPTLCDGRCALAGRANRCLQFCLICCGKCDCVPSGTYGYPPGDCDCYATLKNSKGGHKCPWTTTTTTKYYVASSECIHSLNSPIRYDGGVANKVFFCFGNPVMMVLSTSPVVVSRLKTMDTTSTICVENSE